MYGGNGSHVGVVGGEWEIDMETDYERSWNTLRRIMAELGGYSLDGEAIVAIMNAITGEG